MKEIFTENDIYANIKDRLSNPFLISFAISWLFWNWPITIGLIWYNANNIYQYGFSSYDSLIKCNLDWCFNLVYPLLSAFVYTFAFPFLRNAISSFNANMNKKDQNNVLAISETLNVSTLRYIELQKEYNLKLNDLTELVDKAGVIRSENHDLKGEISKLTDEIQNKENINEFLLKLCDRRILEGRWYVILIDKAGGRDQKIWYIDDRRIRTESGFTNDFEYVIVAYICNPFDKTLSIQLQPVGEKRLVDYNNLKWSEDMKYIAPVQGRSIEMYREKPDNFKDGDM